MWPRGGRDMLWAPWQPRHLHAPGTQDAIDAGAGILRLEPCWVPRTFMIPGRRLRLHPDDLYALGAHRGGINERWFSSTTHASNGPGTPDDEGLSYVRMENGARVLFKSLVDEGGDLLLGSTHDAARRRMEPALQVFRQHGRDSASPASERCVREARRAEGQARGVLLPSSIQPDRKRVSVHVHGPRARHDERRRAALPRELEQGRQRHPVPLARVPAAAGNRLADQSGHPPRPGLARHLRAAGEQRRLRHVPVARRRPRRRSQPADERRAARVSRRSRLSRQHARLGRERESRSSV